MTTRLEDIKVELEQLLYNLNQGTREGGVIETERAREWVAGLGNQVRPIISQIDLSLGLLKMPVPADERWWQRALEAVVPDAATVLAALTVRLSPLVTLLQSEYTGGRQQPHNETLHG